MWRGAKRLTLEVVGRGCTAGHPFVLLAFVAARNVDKLLASVATLLTLLRIIRRMGANASRGTEYMMGIDGDAAT